MKNKFTSAGLVFTSQELDVIQSGGETREELTCSSCKEPDRLCWSKCFGTYCSLITDRRYREIPAGFNRVEGMKSFTTALNKALEFSNFRRTRELLPKSISFPTSCIMYNFDSAMLDIDADKIDHMFGRRSFSVDPMNGQESTNEKTKESNAVELDISGFLDEERFSQVAGKERSHLNQATW